MSDTTSSSPEVPLTLDGHPDAHAGDTDEGADPATTPSTVRSPLVGTRKGYVTRSARSGSTS